MRKKLFPVLFFSISISASHFALEGLGQKINFVNCQTDFSSLEKESPELFSHVKVFLCMHLRGKLFSPVPTNGGGVGKRFVELSLNSQTYRFSFAQYSFSGHQTEIDGFKLEKLQSSKKLTDEERLELIKKKSAEGGGFAVPEYLEIWKACHPFFLDANEQPVPWCIFDKQNQSIRFDLCEILAEDDAKYEELCRQLSTKVNKGKIKYYSNDSEDIEEINLKGCEEEFAALRLVIKNYLSNS